MNPLEVIWEVASAELGNTRFWPPVVVGTVIVLGLLRLLTKFRKWRYRVGAIAMAVGLIMAECNFLLKWHCTVLYLLAGLFLALPILCFFCFAFMEPVSSL